MYHLTFGDIGSHLELFTWHWKPNGLSKRLKDQSRVWINLSKLHREKPKRNFTPFTFTWMHPRLCLRVKIFSYHVDCWKMHFPHWIKVSSQSIFFEWQKLNASNENFVSAATIIANLIFLANSQTPQLRIYHIRISLLVTFVIDLLALPKENYSCKG